MLIVGVNGSGKTTTIGKLATRLQKERKRVLLVAADTFRAAAAEQLAVWAERSGSEHRSRRGGRRSGLGRLRRRCARRRRATPTSSSSTRPGACRRRPI